MANARERVAGDEHQTMSVARAGWITDIPVPSSAAAAMTSASVDARPIPADPAAAAAEPTTTTGSGPRRSMIRPVNGSATRAARAKTASTTPAVLAPRSRTRAT